jgi:hypothetical protein
MLDLGMLGLEVLAKMVFSPECFPPFSSRDTSQVMCFGVTKHRERDKAERTRRISFEVYFGQIALKAHKTLLWPVPFFLFMSFPVHLGVNRIVAIWKCALIHFDNRGRM